MPSSSNYSDVDWNVVGDEVVTHLRDLLRLDTRNPPGNETLAAEYLRGVLEQEGIACEIVGPAPNRGTIVARLKGDGSEPPLLLMWYHQLPKFSDKSGQSVFAALNQSGLPGVPTAFQEVIGSGEVRESMQTRTCPCWTSDSPTTLRAGSSACGPGLFQRECPPQASPPRPIAAEGVLDSSAAAFESRLPVPFLVEGVMNVDRSVVIGMRFVVAHRTAEQFAPLRLYADPATDGEPLPPGSTTRAIL